VIAIVLTSLALVLALITFQERQPPAAGDAPVGHPTDEVAYQPRFSAPMLESVVRPVAEAIDAGAFPGAVLAIGVGAEEAHLLGLGSIGWTRNALPADPQTSIYDLASLTKVIATASAAMLLVEDGKLSLDDPLSRFFGEFQTGPKAEVTIRHLLTHTSGLPAGATLRDGSRRDRIARAARFQIFPPAGARVEYSDIGYILLGEALERAAGEPLPAYLERRLFRPLGMNSTGYSPGLDCESCAPTGRLRDQSLYRGLPFDPLAQRLDGISGNSGLFSTAHDMGRFAAMIANAGELDGVRVMEPETVREFVGPQPVGSRFRLGWEVLCDSGPDEGGGECASPLAIGHNGWTGTSFWIDLTTGLWVVLLTNRTYEPRAPNRMREVRREVFERARSGAAAELLEGATEDSDLPFRGSAPGLGLAPRPSIGR